MNKEYQKLYQKNYREKNKDNLGKKVKDWKNKNPDKVKSYSIKQWVYMKEFQRLSKITIF